MFEIILNKSMKSKVHLNLQFYIWNPIDSESNINTMNFMRNECSKWKMNGKKTSANEISNFMVYNVQDININIIWQSKQHNCVSIIVWWVYTQNYLKDEIEIECTK